MLAVDDLVGPLANDGVLVVEVAVPPPIFCGGLLSFGKTVDVSAGAVFLTGGAAFFSGFGVATPDGFLAGVVVFGAGDDVCCFCW